MKNEAQVIISLEEYEKLKRENKTLSEAFNKNKIVVCNKHIPSFSGSMYEYSVISDSELIKSLINDLIKEKEDNYETSKKIFKLEVELEKKNKKSFWI